MSFGFPAVVAKRMWFVPGLSVSGLAGWSEVDFVVAEQVGEETALLYGSASLGDDAQVVAFADLADHRGNALPATINAPRVLIRPRAAEAVFVVGEESSTGFKIARDPSADGPVTADLLVIEMGT